MPIILIHIKLDLHSVWSTTNKSSYLCVCTSSVKVQEKNREVFLNVIQNNFIYFSFVCWMDINSVHIMILIIPMADHPHWITTTSRSWAALFTMVQSRMAVLTFCLHPLPCLKKMRLTIMLSADLISHDPHIESRALISPSGQSQL